MKKLFILLLLTTISLGLTLRAGFAQTAPATVLTGIKDESNYYKFANLVHSANLDATLTALGTYTVFAPHNILFRNMSQSKLDSVVNDPAKLVMVLKGHIVKGKFNKTEIFKRMTAGKGKTTLTNLLGQPLVFALNKEKQLTVTDNKGNEARFFSFDIPDPHGVIFGIDNVLVIGR